MDRLPIGLTDEAQRVRLLSYVWADQIDRLERLRAALQVATAEPPAVDAADAADWTEAQLAGLESGVTTVLYHSVVWLYLSEPARARIRAAIAKAGSRATREAGFAHLTFETAADDGSFSLDLTLWPGGEHRQLARSHPHGRWVKWLV